jgi:hypothetical protein
MTDGDRGWSAPGADQHGSDAPRWDPPTYPAGTTQQPGWDQPPAWQGAYGFGRAGGPQPGIIPLRPLTVGELLDSAFSLVRRHARLTIGLAAAVLIPEALLNIAVQAWAGGGHLVTGRTVLGPGTSVDSGSSGTRVVASLVATPIGAAFAMFLAGVMAAVAADAILGRPVSWASVWARVRPVRWRLVGTSLLAGLLPFLGLIGFIVGGIFLWGALALAAPACVLERLGAWTALRRSWRLAVPDWWRVWGVRALSVVIAGVISSILGIVAGVIVGVAATSGHASTTGTGAFLVVTALSTAVEIVVQPFVAAVLALLYVDRRMRAEGLDVTLARAAG